MTQPLGKPFFVAVALTACCMSLGCRRVDPDVVPSTAAGDTKPEPAPEATPDPEPEATPPPEPVRPFEIVYYVDRQLWQIEPDGSNARSLGYEVPDDGHEGGSRVGGGTGEPTVSRDGKWLACLTGTNVLVVELAATDGPRVHQLTKLPPVKDEWLVAANVSYSEWSPDSSTLLVLLEEPSYEEDDPLPLPPGYQYGFHVLRTDDLQLVHAPQIESYLGWLPDSSAVLDSKYIAASNYQLVAYPIVPGPAIVLQRSQDPYGFSQVSIMGEFMAWTAHGTDSSQQSSSQIVVAPISPIAGGDPMPLSPRAKFAEIQWPMLAPGGKRAVFAQDGKLMLGEGDGPPVKWPSHSDFHWWDAEHVVTVTSAGLVMMDLQGQVRVLDPAGTDIVHH